MKKIACVLLLCLLVIEAENKCDYNIVAPNSVKLGTDFIFNVDYQCNETSTFALTVSIVAWNRWSSINTPSVTVATKQFVVNSGDYKRFILEVPKVDHKRSTLNLSVEATGGENFTETKPIESNNKYLSLFVQTDKHFYKPGQTVHYRVISFDGNLKPYTKPFNITVHDNRGNLVIQRLMEASEFGVLKGEVELSPVTPLGDWKLTARCEESIKTVYFSVSEYVLPKYKVEIHTPKYYLINYKKEIDGLDKGEIEDFKFSVSAKYTYGKPVRGTATVLFTLKGRYRSSSASTRTHSIIVQLEAGKADVSVAYNDILSLIPCRSDYDGLEYKSIHIKVVLLERETGKQLTESKSVQVRSGKYKLQFIGHNSYFKAGFKSREFIQLIHTNEEKPILSDIVHQNGSMKSLAIRVKYTMSNFSSHIEHKMLIPIKKNGFAVLELVVNKMVEKISIEASFYDSSTGHLTYSPHKTLTSIKTKNNKLLDLQLKLGKGFLKPNQETAFTLNSSEAITTFHYQLFGKNILIMSEKVVGEESKNHEFSVHITEKLALELAPKAQILVFYITSEGELVADGMKIEVDEYFANNVSLKLNETTVLPSSTVSLNIQAPQQSYVGYFAIDQSVLLMGSYDLFSQQQVENDLKDYSIKHFRNWDRKKRSVMVDEDDDDEGEVNGKFLWPTHTLARSTSELISNAGIVVFTSSYIHKHIQFYDYSYSDDEMDSPVAMSMEAPESSLGRIPNRSMKQSSGASAATPAPAVRENFPETWFWIDFVKSTSEDMQEVLKVPDTITEWLVSAFSMHASKGIGLSKPTHLTVFKPLFVSVNLPASIIRGEELALTITLFNYLPKPTLVTVTLKRSSNFQIKRCTSENINDLISEDVVKTFEIKADDAASFHLWLVASSLGEVAIEVEAISEEGSDAVKRSLLVKPEGQQQWKTRNSFIKSSVSTPSNTSFSLELPSSENYVSDSIIFQLTTIGDIMAPVTANIGRLVSVPRGCGEQNIVNLAPNVYALSYLNAANVSNQGLKDKLISHIRTGYQQQMTFQRREKSYSAFGDDDLEGSTWLTAFVLKSLKEAQRFIAIEDSHLQESMVWLLQRQAGDGSFSELPASRIIHDGMQGGSGSTLTAYVLIALLKSPVFDPQTVQHNKLHVAINKATAYLENHLDEYQDAYTLSIVAYAFHLSNSSSLERVVEKLEALANEKDGRKHWKQISSNDTTDPEDLLWIAFGKQPPTHEIEMTAYNLLIRVEQGSIEKALPIAQWLIEQGNGIGGFVSTQDTVLAIEALSKFAKLIMGQSELDLDISVSYDNAEGEKTEVSLEKITEENSLLLQTTDLPSDTKKVDVTAIGEGFALIQLVSRFNTHTEHLNNHLHLTLDSHVSEDQLNLTIKTKWSKIKKSGMVIVEVKTLTGYSLHDIDMLRLQLRGVVQKVEVKDDVINFYLDQLTADSVEFTVTFEKQIAVHAIKPASVHIYTYYQPNVRSTKYYTVESGLTWVSACPKCCE